MVYVDDLLITRCSLKLIESTKESLKQVFKMNDLGELRFFFRIEFARLQAALVMHQRKYTLELIFETGLQELS